MIVVRVELWSARTGEKTELARMHISNVGGTDHVGDYSGKVLRRPSWSAVTRQALVRGHRRQELVVWVLVRRMLQALGY